MKKPIIGAIFTSLIVSSGYACFAENFSKTQAASIYRSGNWNAMAQYASRWSQAEPNNSLSWYFAGEAAYYQHNYPKALQNYQRAAQAEPTQPDYWGSMSNVYLAEGNKPAAVQAIFDGERSCAKTMQAGNWYNFGSILGQANQTAHSNADLQKAIALNPRYGAAWTTLGINAIREGNKTLAQQYFNKGAALGDPQAKSIVMRTNMVAAKSQGLFDERNPYIWKAIHNPTWHPLNNVCDRINAEYIQQHGYGNNPIGGH